MVFLLFCFGSMCRVCFLLLLLRRLLSKIPSTFINFFLSFSLSLSISLRGAHVRAFVVRLRVHTFSISHNAHIMCVRTHREKYYACSFSLSQFSTKCRVLLSTRDLRVWFLFCFHFLLFSIVVVVVASIFFSSLVLLLLWCVCCLVAIASAELCVYIHTFSHWILVILIRTQAMLLSGGARVLVACHLIRMYFRCVLFMCRVYMLPHIDEMCERRTHDRHINTEQENRVRPATELSECVFVLWPQQQQQTEAIYQLDVRSFVVLVYNCQQP